jgi:membrane associated rhomboid family serine protease
VTIGLLATSWGIQYQAWSGGELAFATPYGGLDLVLFLHPLIHNNWAHLASNTVFGFMAGILIESWMMIRCRSRWEILGLCYASSLVAAYLKWKYVGPSLAMTVGLSGMISAAITTILVYYWLFHGRIRLYGVGALAPLGIGLLLWFLVEPFYDVIYGAIQLSDTLNFHLIAFFVPLLPAFLLLRRSRRDVFSTEAEEHHIQPAARFCRGNGFCCKTETR